ncbi:MAG: response regulator [Planctomycetota bacterium]
MHILVVEDHEFLRVNLIEQLAALGYEAQGVGTGAEALTAVREGGQSLVLLDLGLPDMRGDDVLRQLQELAQDLPILVCSGATPRALNTVGGQQSQVRVLNKPFNLQQLADTVRSILTGASS